MKEVFINPDNLKESDIDETVIRVKAIIINNKNEILLGYSHKTYQFPGGHHEEGETLDETLNRELKEEMGMDITKDKRNLIMVTRYYSKNYRQTGKNRENVIYFYEVKTNSIHDMSQSSLDDNEKDGNYQPVLVRLEEIEDVLIKSIPDNKINEIIVSEMLQVLGEYKKSKE